VLDKRRRALIARRLLVLFLSYREVIHRSTQVHPKCESVVAFIAFHSVWIGRIRKKQKVSGQRYRILDFMQCDKHDMVYALLGFYMMLFLSFSLFFLRLVVTCRQTTFTFWACLFLCRASPVVRRQQAVVDQELEVPAILGSLFGLFVSIGDPDIVGKLIETNSHLLMVSSTLKIKQLASVAA
jgi:hypothetical protein